jgi:hypothetical protein
MLESENEKYNTTLLVFLKWLNTTLLVLKSKNEI